MKHRLITQPQWLLILSALLLLTLHQLYFPLSQTDLASKQLYTVKLNASFQDGQELVNVHTYLPINDPWQTVLHEKVSINGVPSTEQLLPSGRLITWSADEEQVNLGYQFKVYTQGQQYTIDPSLMPPDTYSEELDPYLSETQDIQVSHPEIQDLWQKIQGSDRSVYGILDAIYQHTWKGIENVPFKGTTDALTAARLGAASCNGKSRLFVALARKNGIPARLIGGLILENTKKKTSHQWIEVYINEHWVSFDPTNGHFANRPSHYLKLYEGDQALFRHTSNIGFDYLFSINSQIVSPALYPSLLNDSQNYLALSQAMTSMQLSSNTLAIILLFPLCSLLITFLRNVIGIQTFGIFMPILVAAPCMYTGLILGVVGFILILAMAWFCHHILEKLRILKTARLAIVVSIISIFFVLLLWHSAIDQKLEFGMLALMPVVIISFVAERIHQVTQDSNWSDLIQNTWGSLLTIVLCYLYLTSHLLQSMFTLYPEFYLFVIAGLIIIGQWDGIRASEVIRFKHLPSNEKSNLMGINNRNRNIIYQYNDKALLRLAMDKLASKKRLKEHHVPVPATLLAIKNQADLSNHDDTLMRLTSFAVKPNAGSQGKGILIVKDKSENYITASGKEYSLVDLKRHIKEILVGHFSQTGEQDIAYLEPLIIQDDSINNLCDLGLSDIRVILAKGTIISAMLRMPTQKSNGKANLHQGAIGIAVDISNGKTINAIYKGQTVTHHPDTDEPLLNFTLPYWEEIKAMSVASYQAIPLGYLGVDICIDHKTGPLVLEVNGRAGLEIQNIQKHGLKKQIFKAVQ